MDIPQQLLKVNKLLNSWFNKTDKKEKACSILEQIASNYKINNEFEKSGDIYLKMVDIYKTLPESNYEIIQCYKKAIQVYKRVNINKAIEINLILIALSTDAYELAKFWESLGNLYEKESLDEAVKSFIKSGELYGISDKHQHENNILKAAIRICIAEHNYDTALTIYDQIIANSIGNNIDKYHMHTYIYECLLCHMITQIQSKCFDCDKYKKIVERYVNNYPSYQESRPAKFLEKCIESYETGDTKLFQEIMYDQNGISEFSKFEINVMLELKTLFNGTLRKYEHIDFT